MAEVVEMNHNMNGHVAAQKPRKAFREEVNAQAPPQFASPLQPAETSVIEGEEARLEVYLQPIRDNTLTIEWYKDGKLMDAGSRFNWTLDRDYVSMDIYYTVAEDNGQYVCVAKNAFGAVQSSPAVINVTPDSGVVKGTQLPEEEMVERLLEMEYQLRDMDMYGRVDRHAATHAPQMLAQLPANLEVAEFEPVHLEMHVAPPADSSMHVSWFRNGQEIKNGSRFNIFYDRGLCVLDIAYMFPEDSGNYTCVAKNALGQVESNTAALHCTAGAAIVTKSNLDENSAGFQRIKALEEIQSSIRQGNEDDFMYQEMPEPDTAPRVEMAPMSQYAAQDGPARFLVRLEGHPRPEVQWLINDQLVVPDTNYFMYNDGAINVLEILRCPNVGECKVTVLAANNLGQTDASCVLSVVPAEDYRPDLKHIRPTNPYQKLAQLKSVERTPELNNAFQRPKPTQDKIFDIELEADKKGRQYKTADILEAEHLYEKVSQGLRKPENRVAAAGFRPPRPVANPQAPHETAHHQLHKEEISSDMTIQLE